MSISWGQIIGGIAAVTGVAVAGVGGGSVAHALGTEGTLGAIGKFFGEAGEVIADHAESAAKFVGLSPEIIEKLGGGKGIAAIVGGIAAVGGGAAMALGGKSQDDSQDQELSELIKILPPEAKKQLADALKMAMSQSAPPMPTGKGKSL